MRPNGLYGPGRVKGCAITWRSGTIVSPRRCSGPNRCSEVRVTGSAQCGKDRFVWMVCISVSESVGCASGVSLGLP